MPIAHAVRFRLTCAAALLSLSGLGHSALPEPKQPDPNFNWYNNNTLFNSAYALGVSHWNILRYYDEAKARYGALPPAAQLSDATAGWDIYQANRQTLIDKWDSCRPSDCPVGVEDADPGEQRGDRSERDEEDGGAKRHHGHPVTAQPAHDDPPGRPPGDSDCAVHPVEGDGGPGINGHGRSHGHR